MPPALAELRAQRNQFGEQHRLAAGQNHMPECGIPPIQQPDPRPTRGFQPIDLGDNLGHIPVFTLGPPTREGGVAEPTAEVAAAGPYQRARRASESSFSLQRRIDLGDTHANDNQRRGVAKQSWGLCRRFPRNKYCIAAAIVQAGCSAGRQTPHRSNVCADCGDAASRNRSAS